MFKSYLRKSKEFFEELFTPNIFKEEIEGLAYYLANKEPKDKLEIYHTEAKENVQELSKHPICQAVKETAFNPNQVIAEVAFIKKLPLVYKQVEDLGSKTTSKYKFR